MEPMQTSTIIRVCHPDISGTEAQLLSADPSKKYPYVVHTIIPNSISMIPPPKKPAVTSTCADIRATTRIIRPTNPIEVKILSQTSLYQIMGIPQSSPPSSLAGLI